MPTPLNKIPAGVLDFLGIKSGGRYPQILGEQLAPTLELLDWYLNTNSEHYDLTGANLASGAPALFDWTAMGPGDLRNGAGQLQVPAGEFWCLLNYQVFWQFAAAAADNAQLSVVYTLINPGNRTYLLPQFQLGYVQSVAAQPAAGAHVMDGKQWIPPGAILGYNSQLAVTGGGPTTVGGRIRLVRFRI